MPLKKTNWILTLISIDVAWFFREGGLTLPPKMLKFFSGGKVGYPGGK